MWTSSSCSRTPWWSSSSRRPARSPSSATRSRAARPGARRLGGRIPSRARHGLRLRSRLLTRAFDEPSVSVRERAFLAIVRGRSTGSVTSASFYVGGAADLLDDLRTEEIGATGASSTPSRSAPRSDVLANSLGMRRRSSASGTSSSSLAALAGARGRDVRPGDEATGDRQPSGPPPDGLREGSARRRAAAHELSRFVEEVYADE
jgi:hypothetical protein